MKKQVTILLSLVVSFLPRKQESFAQKTRPKKDQAEMMKKQKEEEMKKAQERRRKG